LLQAAEHHQTSQEEGDEQAFAQDQPVLVAFISLGIAQEKQEQAHENGRMVGKEHDTDEKDEMDAGHDTGTALPASLSRASGKVSSSS